MKSLDLNVPEDAKFREEELSLALDCLLNHESNTSWVELFEKEFADKINVNFAIACNSGTSGLHAALYAADVGPGDEVIIATLSVIMDAYAVMHLGAVPRFADVDIHTHLVTAETIEKLITPKTKAIITVAWEGLSCDMDPIMELAKKHNLLVIDDCARTFLGKYKGRYSGTLADISVFSFEAKKHLTAGGEGGMIVTNNETLATRARKFAGIGYRHLNATAGRTHLALDEVQDPNYMRFDTIGLNYRMNSISAAVGLGQLRRSDEIVNRRMKIGKMFEEATAGFDWFIPQKTPDDYVHAYYTFSVQYLGEQKLNISWKEFYHKFKELGADGFYSIVGIPYLEPALSNKVIGGVKCETGLAPVSEHLQRTVMCFKTNYRDIAFATEQVDKLHKLIKSL